MRLKIEPDGETTECLIRQAVIENRPVHMQAEIMLRRACGLPDPPVLPLLDKGKFELGEMQE